jgi:hypothetical protein
MKLVQMKNVFAVFFLANDVKLKLQLTNKKGFLSASG